MRNFSETSKRWHIQWVTEAENQAAQVRQERENVRTPGNDTHQYLLEILDSEKGLVFVKNLPSWGENRRWEAIGSVRLVEGHRSKIIKGLSGIAIGDIEADELEEIRQGFSSE